MKTYYFCFECVPVAASENAGRHKGMVADIFVKDVHEGPAEKKVIECLEKSGWQAIDLQHFELVSNITPHDARLVQIYNSAQKEGISMLISPFS